MSETQTIPTAGITGGHESEAGFLNLLIILAKHKRLILTLPLVAGCFAAGLSLLMPDVFKASSKLLPPQQAQSGAAALLSQLSGQVGGVGGLKSPTDLYMGILKSRTIGDRLINQFDLKKVYGTDSQERARSKLEMNTIISSGKDGLITVEVADVDKSRVAKLTNAYVNELINLTGTLALTEAAQRRKFYEKQLELAKNNLATSEITLKSTLDTGGVVNVDGDSRAIAVTVAGLRAQISANEVKLNSMRAFVTSENQEFKRTLEALRSARAELSSLENGRPATGGTIVPNPVGLANIQTLRDVKYYQMLYEMLAKQYELARLDEARDVASVQVLDVAVEPEKKFKPKRALIVLAVVLLAFCFALVLAYAAELREQYLSDRARHAKWKFFLSHLRWKN